jgi:hypothetical protein
MTSNLTRDEIWFLKALRAATVASLEHRPIVSGSLA